MALADLEAAIMDFSPLGFWPQQDLSGSIVEDVSAGGNDMTISGGTPVTFNQSIGVQDVKSIVWPGSGSTLAATAGSPGTLLDDFTLICCVNFDSFNFDESGASGYGTLLEWSGLSWLIAGDAPAFGQTHRTMGGVWASSFQGFNGTVLSPSTPYMFVLRRKLTAWQSFLNGSLDAGFGTSGASTAGTVQFGRALKAHAAITALLPTPIADSDIADLFAIFEADPAPTGPALVMPPHFGGYGAC